MTPEKLREMKSPMMVGGFMVIVVPDIPGKQKVGISPDFEWITEKARSEINEALAERFGFHDSSNLLEDGDTIVDNKTHRFYVNPRTYESLNKELEARCELESL